MKNNILTRFLEMMFIPEEDRIVRESKEAPEHPLVQIENDLGSNPPIAPSVLQVNENINPNVPININTVPIADNINAQNGIVTSDLLEISPNTNTGQKVFSDLQSVVEDINKTSAIVPELVTVANNTNNQTSIPIATPVVADNTNTQTGIVQPLEYIRDNTNTGEGIYSELVLVKDNTNDQGESDIKLATVAENVNYQTPFSQELVLSKPDTNDQLPSDVKLATIVENTNTGSTADQELVSVASDTNNQTEYDTSLVSVAENRNAQSPIGYGVVEEPPNLLNPFGVLGNRLDRIKNLGKDLHNTAADVANLAMNSVVDIVQSETAVLADNALKPITDALSDIASNPLDVNTIEGSVKGVADIPSNYVSQYSRLKSKINSFADQFNFDKTKLPDVMEGTGTLNTDYQSGKPVFENIQGEQPLIDAIGPIYGKSIAGVTEDSSNLGTVGFEALNESMNDIRITPYPYNGYRPPAFPIGKLGVLPLQDFVIQDLNIGIKESINAGVYGEIPIILSQYAPAQLSTPLIADADGYVYRWLLAYYQWIFGKKGAMSSMRPYKMCCQSITVYVTTYKRQMLMARTYIAYPIFDFSFNMQSGVKIFNLNWYVVGMLNYGGDLKMNSIPMHSSLVIPDTKALSSASTVIAKDESAPIDVSSAVPTASVPTYKPRQTGLAEK